MKESRLPTLSKEDMNELVKSIGEPTLELLMKLVKENLLCKKHEKMEIEEFLLVLFASVCSIDSSVIKWVTNCMNNNSENSIKVDSDSLRLLYMKLLNEQLGVDVH